MKKLMVGFTLLVVILSANAFAQEQRLAAIHGEVGPWEFTLPHGLPVTSILEKNLKLDEDNNYWLDYVKSYLRMLVENSPVDEAESICKCECLITVTMEAPTVSCKITQVATYGTP